MSAISFRATIGPDQMIRPPHGVALPAGEFEVTIRPVAVEPLADDPVEAAPGYDWLMGLVDEMKRNAPDLPADMAENHDHYAHGKPLP